MDLAIYNGYEGITIGDTELYIQISISAAEITANTHSFHSHKSHEFLTVDSGAIEIEFISSKSITVVPGTVCYIPAGTMHYTKAAEGTPKKMGVRYAYTQNRNTLVKSAQLYKGFDRAVLEMVSPSIVKDSVEMGQILSCMAQNADDRSYLSATLFKAMYQILGVGIMRLIGGHENSRNNTPDISEQTELVRKKNIEEWLEHWYSHGVNEAWVSRIFNLSKRQINRLFHKYFNMSFRDKLTEVRLRHSVEYLLNTDMKVEEIAYKVGYTTAASFQNAFSRKYGISPGKYRNENRKKSKNML